MTCGIEQPGMIKKVVRQQSKRCSLRWNMTPPLCPYFVAAWQSGATVGLRTKILFQAAHQGTHRDEVEEIQNHKSRNPVKDGG